MWNFDPCLSIIPRLRAGPSKSLSGQSKRSHFPARKSLESGFFNVSERVNVVSIDASQARRMAYSIVIWQAVTTVVVALASWMIAGGLAALSALVGGGMGTLGSLALAVLAFRPSAVRDPMSAVRAFFVGEAAKLVTVVVLFIVVLRTMKVSPLAMFVAYVATFFVYWVALANALPTLGSSRAGTSSARHPG